MEVTVRPLRTESASQYADVAAIPAMVRRALQLESSILRKALQSAELPAGDHASVRSLVRCLCLVPAQPQIDDARIGRGRRPRYGSSLDAEDRADPDQGVSWPQVSVGRNWRMVET